jgi:glycosyltransferase involved in cell wall biosynthesis
MQRMKICIATSSFPHAQSTGSRFGGGGFALDFAQELAALGHRITVLTSSRTDASVERIGAIEVVGVPSSFQGLAASYLKFSRPGDWVQILSLVFGGCRTLTRLHKERCFDHVLALWAVPAGLWASYVRFQTGTRFSVWCLGSDIWTYSKLPILRYAVRGVLRYGTVIFADGTQLAREAEALSGRRCLFLPTSRRLHQEWSEVPHTRTDAEFMFIGRYVEVKGVDILLEAAAQYVRQGGQWRIAMYGTGPLEAFLHTRIQELKLADVVAVHGVIGNADLVRGIRLSQAVLIPSRQESIPVILSDTLQLGRPVIVSDVGDMGTLVRGHHAGIVVPPGDSHALAEAMLAFEQSDREDFATGIHALSQLFDVRTTAKTWLSCIDHRE